MISERGKKENLYYVLGFRMFQNILWFYFWITVNYANIATQCAKKNQVRLAKSSQQTSQKMCLHVVTAFPLFLSLSRRRICGEKNVHSHHRGQTLSDYPLSCTRIRSFRFQSKWAWRAPYKKPGQELILLQDQKTQNNPMI